MHQALVDSIKCSMVLLPLLRDDAAVASKFVDMSAYEFVEFHAHIGAVDATTTVAIKAQQSTAADGSGATDVTSAAIVAVEGDGDNVLVVISIKAEALTKQYVGVLVTIATGDGANVSVEAFRWGKTGVLPESQASAGANSYATTQVIRV